MPVLSGFLPIPLAMMIPFMGAQSLVIGKQFGEGFQYGKRKISAMSNEEFNAMTPAKLAMDNAAEMRQMIPSMKQSIHDMRDFQSFLIRELIATAKQLPSDIFSGAKEAFEGGDPRFQRTFGEAFDEDVTQKLRDFYEKQIKGEEFGTAAAEDTPQTTNLGSQTTFKRLNAIESYAQKWITYPTPTQKGMFLNSNSIRLSEINYLLTQKMKGNMPNTPMSMLKSLSAREKKARPKKLTPTQIQQKTKQVIQKTSTGLVKQIASKFTALKFYLNSAIKHRSNRTAGGQQLVQKQLSSFIRLAKEYNRLVQSSGKRNLTIDTMKSAKAFKIIPRYT